MTKRERKADDLLAAARYWQNGYGSRSPSTIPVAAGLWSDLYPECAWLMGRADVAASAALSEVAALGFDIEGAT